MTDIQEKTGLVKSHYQANPFDFKAIRRKIFEASLTHEVIQEHDLSQKRIIDVGCSTSYLGEYIRTNHPAYRYLGIDLNPAAVAIAKAKGLNVREGNNLQLDIPDQYSDFTISEGVIHHTPDPFQCFKELIRITKPGGLISLYVYNRNHLYFIVYKASIIFRKLVQWNLTPRLIVKIIFPIFNRFYVQLGHRIYFKSNTMVPREVAWSIFNDQILTPIAHFFTRKPILDFAKTRGLVLMRERLSINRQGLMFLFKKPQSNPGIEK